MTIKPCGILPQGFSQKLDFLPPLGYNNGNKIRDREGEPYAQHCRSDRPDPSRAGGIHLDASCVPVSLLMERRHITGDAASILVRCGDVPVFTAEREVLAQLTGFALTRGVLCAMRRPKLPAVEALCAGAHRVAVLEGIVDPTNVGAIFRSAAALHMDAVLVTPTCCDPLYPRAARVSMGTIIQGWNA